MKITDKLNSGKDWTKDKANKGIGAINSRANRVQRRWNARKDRMEAFLEARAEEHIWDKAAFGLFKVVRHAEEAIFKAIADMFRHIESVAILTLSSIGLAHLIGELPFYYLLPMWIEAPMVTVIIAVIIILSLIKLAGWRRSRRLSVA